VTRLQVKEEKQGTQYLVWQAKNYPIKEYKQRIYVVQVEPTKEEYTCICYKFQKDGLLCSHILKVMLHQNIDKISDKYIIDRWRKNEKLLPNIQTVKVADNDTLRYNVLTRRLVHTASKGSKSKKKYEYLLKEIDRVEDAMAKMDGETEEVPPEPTLSIRTVANIGTASNEGGTGSPILLLDPAVANTKGLPRHLTIRESIKANKFYKCSHCGDVNHTLRNCHNKHLAFNLPKTKKPRRSKKADTGEL
jgi:hypothetical protein